MIPVFSVSVHATVSHCIGLVLMAFSNVCERHRWARLWLKRLQSVVTCHWKHRIFFLFFNFGLNWVLKTAIKTIISQSKPGLWYEIYCILQHFILHCRYSPDRPTQKEEEFRVLDKFENRDWQALIKDKPYIRFEVCEYVSLSTKIVKLPFDKFKSYDRKIVFL